MRLQATILALTLAVTTTLAGCSFAFVNGPPDNHAQLSYFDCTSSRLVPVLDTILTGLMALNVITLGAQNDSDWAKTACPSDNPTCNPPISRHGAMVIDAVLGAAGAAGMVYGYTRTGACRRAKSEQAMRQPPQQPYTPGSWPPPQGAPPGQPGQPGSWPPPQQGASPPGQPGQPGSWPPPPAQGAPQPTPQPAPQPQSAPQPQPAPQP